MSSLIIYFSTTIILDLPHATEHGNNISGRSNASHCEFGMTKQLYVPWHWSNSYVQILPKIYIKKKNCKLDV